LASRFLRGIPGVRIIASPAVVDRINKVYQEKIDKWKKVLAQAQPHTLLILKHFDGDFIDFDRSKIEIL